MPAFLPARYSRCTGKNFFYHNNFINNILPNAYDNTDNKWDNGYTSGGNYWSNYYGKDNDGDGIGDISYSISGGDNKDRYPLMEAWGNVNFPPDTPTIMGQRRFKVGDGGIYPYTIYSKDHNGDNVCYLINWNDGTQEWTGYYSSGEEIKIDVNIPSENGTYEIFKIKAKDSFGAESDWETLEISVPRTRTSFWFRFLDMFPIIKVIALCLIKIIN